MYDLTLNGTIVGKYFDTKEHNYPIFEIQDNRIGIQNNKLDKDMRGLFEY